MMRLLQRNSVCLKICKSRIYISDKLSWGKPLKFFRTNDLLRLYAVGSDFPCDIQPHQPPTSTYLDSERISQLINSTISFHHSLAIDTPAVQHLEQSLQFWSVDSCSSTAKWQAPSWTHLWFIYLFVCFYTQLSDAHNSIPFPSPFLQLLPTTDEMQRT